MRKGGVRGEGKYVYQSADVYAIEGSCDATSCEVKQQVKLRFRQNVTGGDSKKWKLQMYTQAYSGSRVFQTGYHYECGVNIAKEKDWTCSSWRDDGADRSSDGAGRNGLMITKAFGRSPNVKKFPMFKIDVKFADGTRARGDDGQEGEKFRGWDVCVKRKARAFARPPERGEAGGRRRIQR